jgi:hypothetical protein
MALFEKDDRVKLIPLLLKCPGIHNASHVVTAVVEEGLIEMMMDSGAADDWFDDGWYYGHLKDRLWDGHGNIILAAHGEELWNFMSNPEIGFINYCNQVDDLITAFYTHNEDVINAAYNGYDIKSIKVARAYKNQWLLLAEGVRL